MVNVQQPPLAPRCQHAYSISNSLRNQLSNKGLCPYCIIRCQTDDIKRIQTAFERRGGIHNSKEMSLAASRDSEQHREHRDLVKRLTATKVKLSQDVQNFKKLVKGETLGRYDKVAIRLALELYANKNGDMIEQSAVDGEEVKVRPNESTVSKLDHELIGRLSLQGEAVSSPRRIRFSDAATIIPDSSSSLAVQRPHNAHTEAENLRCPMSSPKIDRLSSKIKAGIWVLPEGHEKMDTSFRKVRWRDVRRMQREIRGEEEALYLVGLWMVFLGVQSIIVGCAAL